MEGSSGANNNMPVSLKQAKLVSDREHVYFYMSTNTSEQQHGEGCLPAFVVVVVVVGMCACVWEEWCGARAHFGKPDGFERPRRRQS